MSLKSLTLPSRTVATPGGDLVVRGLSFNSAMGLINRHGPILMALFQQYVGVAETEQRLLMAQAVTTTLLQTAPELIAEIIVLGAGDSVEDNDALDMAAGLAIASQMEVLSAIAEMTFDSEGGPGNFLRLVLKTAQGTTSLFNDLQT